MSVSVLQPSQLDYQVREILNPNYKFVKIPLNNLPSAGTAIAAGSQQLLEWKLPTQVYNLGRSYIEWNENYPAQGATLNTWTHEDTFTLGSSVSFGQSGGVNLVDLQYAQNFMKISRKIRTPIEDYLLASDMSGLYKCNTPSTPPLLLTVGFANNATVANNLVRVDLATDINTGNVVPGGSGRAAPLAYTPFDGSIEPRYASATTSANNILNRYRQYPLGAFKGTLLGLDREFYSPTEMYLRINAGTGDKMAFTNVTSITDPSASAASVAGLTINNCYLFLAVEQNASIVKMVMDTYARNSLTFQMPYTVAFRNLGGPASSTTNIQIQISQQFGRKLKKILHTAWNPAERLNTAYDCQNYNGAKIASYQTFMDNIPLQDRQLSCLQPTGTNINMDDWLENRKFLEDSVITSKEAYQLNWHHTDQFFAPTKREERHNVGSDNLDEGLPMLTPHQWQFTATAGATAGLIHYTYVEFARDVMVTPNGPVFV